MRKIMTFLLCTFAMVVNAQIKKGTTIHLEISYDKTLHLIFDNSIKYIDGAPDIIAEMIPALPNIVKVKVNNENYVGTRGLSVITSDGVFHSFELAYKGNVDYSTYYDNKKDSSVVTTINVANNKSTHIIFPSKIVYSDVGNEETLASETISSNNILKIKSLTGQKVLPTSLFVATEDKKNYEFLMNFDSLASTYTYNFCNTEDAAIFENTTNDKMLSLVAEKCLKERKQIYSVGERKNKLTCFLNNIHINNDVLYFTFELINTSTINMNIDLFRCFIRDKETIQNSPEQEIEITPILNYKYQPKIESNTSCTFVLAFPKFTIPDKKKFEIQLVDRDGGRHLSFSIKDSFIINAVPIR